MQAARERMTQQKVALHAMEPLGKLTGQIDRVPERETAAGISASDQSCGCPLTQRDMPENTIFAGGPARQIRKNMSWSRPPTGFSKMENPMMGLLS